MGKRVLNIVFSAVYFLIFFQIIDYLTGFLTVNFVWDLLAIVCLIIAFVVSIALADKTVQWILNHL